MNFFNQNLIHLTKTKINQNQLSIKMDISRQQVAKWINGREPKFDQLIQIAKIYNITIDDLLLKDLSESEQ